MSLLACLLAIALIVYALVQLAAGQLYVQPLGSIDGTTVIELGLLGLWGVYRLRDRSDLQAVAFTLVNALSFIFSYEAIFKWSFYMTPFRMDIPPAEFRQLVIQLGITLSVLTGFSVGLFTFKKWTRLWLALFIVLWIFWLLAGYPQITGTLIWPRTLPIDFTHNMTYAVNRATKSVLWLAYLSLFPNTVRDTEEMVSG